MSYLSLLNSVEFQALNIIGISHKEAEAQDLLFSNCKDVGPVFSPLAVLTPSMASVVD